jgi:hypothetical protein
MGRRGTEVFGENLPQCRLADHKSHMIWAGLEPMPSLLKPGMDLWHSATNSNIEIFHASNARLSERFTCSDRTRQRRNYAQTQSQPYQTERSKAATTSATRTLNAILS